MQAIATLVLDDPYLKLSADQRLAEFHARRARFSVIGECPAKEAPSRSPRDFNPTSTTEVVIIPEPVEQWTERQRQIHPPIKQIVDEIAPAKKRIPTIEEIQRAVAQEYPGCTFRALYSSCRKVQIVRPRQIAMYLAKTITNRSLPDIGRRFGGRDHTTVLHAVRKIGNLITKDKTLADEVDALKQTLAESVA